MENTIKTSERCRPLRGEFVSHKRSLIVLVILYVIAAYLSIGSIDAYDSGSDNSWYMFLILMGCGIFTAVEAFADTYNASARDIQLSQPIRAGKRYRAKILYIFLRSIVPTVLVLGLAVLNCCRLNAIPFNEPIDIGKAVRDSLDVLQIIVAFDAVAVLALVSTGTLFTAVLVGILVGSTLLRLYLTATHKITELFSFLFKVKISTAEQLNAGLLVLVIIVMLVLAAGAAYVRRDGKHTGRLFFPDAAVEVISGAVLLWIGVGVFGVTDTLLLLMAYVVVHVLIFRKKTLKKIPVMTAVFVSITAVCVGVAWYNYTKSVDSRRDVNSEKLTAWSSISDSERGVDYKKLEKLTVEIPDSYWDDEVYRDGRKYMDKPDCELMVGHYSGVDSKWSNEYHISNGDGSTLNPEQYDKLVALLEEYCSKNEYSTEHEASFLEYARYDVDVVNADYGYFGFQVTVSFGGGKSAQRERCKGHLMTEKSELELLEMIKGAGYKVQMVTNEKR